MRTVVKGAGVKKTNGKVQKQVTQTPAEGPPRGPNPLEELRKQAELAYSSYLGAQRKVAGAYRQREEEEVKAYKLAEQQANDTYDEAIRKALAVRIESERSAREACDRALEKAGQVYQDSVAEALRACRDTIEQRWQTTWELADQIWHIFQGDGVG